MEVGRIWCWFTILGKLVGLIIVIFFNFVLWYFVRKEFRV